jgi:hypothetical protein
MRILTPHFLARAPGPVVNIHPVPTHLYQGPAGYEDIWARREQLVTNFPTVHLVDAGVDTGRVLLYGLPYRVADASSLDELRQRGLAEEHQLYPEALQYLLTVPDVAAADPDASTIALTGISQFARDFLTVAAEAMRVPGGRVRCLAHRDWQGTGYHLRIESKGGPTENVRSGWLAGLERVAFTMLLGDLLRLSRDVPAEFAYEGLTIDLTDTRAPQDAEAAGPA